MEKWMPFFLSNKKNMTVSSQHELAALYGTFFSLKRELKIRRTLRNYKSSSCERPAGFNSGLRGVDSSR
jgi:hypothetical protein